MDADAGQEVNCPSCDVVMEPGFIVDHAHGAIMQALWQPGEPRDQKILGLKTGSVRVDRSRTLKVTTYRCPQCGVLYSYAFPDQ